MKGIIMAGGLGSRLYPMTLAVTKQLMPVYDKPMIYYSLSTLMLAGIREMLLITTEYDLDRYKLVLKDGSDWGISITYAVQSRPAGIAEAFLLGRDFIAGDACALVLGDNIFFGHGLAKVLQNVAGLTEGAVVFAYRVRDPARYGVVEFDGDQQVISIEEKPVIPRSNWAVTGLYFYDRTVCDRAASLSPSKRGELEITDLNNSYLKSGTLRVEQLGRGYTWFDTGTSDALIEAAQFVQVMSHRQGARIACVEEIAFHMGWIDCNRLLELGERLKPSDYGQYLIEVATEHSNAKSPRDKLTV